jgi:hypothetical protein
MKATALLLILGLARAAAAATWTCDQKTEILTGQAYLVAARCTASGTYTSGGDGFGNAGADLCNSAQRRPTQVIVTSAGDTVADQGYVALSTNATPPLIVLVTATSAPGRAVPLLELTAGTSITGTILRTLAVCQ